MVRVYHVHRERIAKGGGGFSKRNAMLLQIYFRFLGILLEPVAH